MKSTEEQLWEYIDGGGTPAQRAMIAQQLATNAQLKQQYEELLQLHLDFDAIELDEPPMAFTYNVMEQIRAEEAAKPLKAGINQRIIWGIAAFFVITLGTAFIVLLAQIDWNAPSKTTFEMPKMPVIVSSQSITTLFTSPLMMGFLSFDVILGLYLFDAWLRRRKNAPAH